MSKVELPTITSGYNLSTINNNFQKVEEELNNKVLYREHDNGEPNHMKVDLDMNSHGIINVGSVHTSKLFLGGEEAIPEGLVNEAALNALNEFKVELLSANGSDSITYTPTYLPNLPSVSITKALDRHKSILDLGAVTGVADAAVDARVVASVEAGYAIHLPDEFNYKLSSYGVLFLSTKPGAIICPSGRAKMTASTAGVMLDMPPPFKFENWYFENIDFVGADKQNPASQFMFAAEGEYAANFTTTNCSWDGFHTIYKASLIGTHHYKPDYFGVGDTGAIADTFHWTTSLYSSFNLNEWHAPRIFGKFGRLFQILGGNSNQGW